MKQILVFFAAIFLITSCKVAFVPQKSADVIQQITAGQHSTDSLYDAMLNATDKSYATFQHGYAIVATEIAFLQLTENMRNKTIASQVEILQKHFVFYEGQHKTKGALSNAELTTYKNDLDALWQPILNSENFLK